MTDKKDPVSAHNPQFEADETQESDTENEIHDVGQVTELEVASISSDQEDAEKATDSLSPMRNEWMLKDSADPDKNENVGKLQTVFEFETGTNDADEEKAEAQAETKVADLLESTPAVLEASQEQAPDSEVHEEPQAQENGDAIIEPMEEEPQQPTELLSQQNGADTCIVTLPDTGSEHKEEDPKEKIMPEEVRQKVSSVVPALLNVVEDDKIRCCGCNCDCTTNCLNTCCLPCNNPFKKRQSQDPNAKEEKFHMFNETLQKGSEAGRAIFQEIIFPLIRPFTRDLIAISEFLVGLTGLILSIVSFALGNNAAYNILHLVLAILSTLLGLIDMLVSLKFSAAFAKVIKKLRSRTVWQPGNDTEENQNREKDSKEPSFLKKGWDTGRVLVSEAILYPLLVCDLIEFIVDKGYEVDEPSDVVNLILFIISSVSLIFYVYIVRLGVLIAMVIHLQKCRQLNPEQKKALDEWSAKNKVTTEKGDELDPTTATKARNFQIYFILHVMGQMAAQIMMIVAVSLKIADDNRNRTLDDQLHISNELWFMLVAGYIMPFLGILSFFVPTFYWVYEHENGLCLDILSLLNMPGIDHVLFPDGDEIKEACESIRKIALKLNDGNKLRESFKELRNVDFGKKLSYAFRNPFLVAACLVYSFAQLAFVVTAIVAIQNETLGTIIYYILSIIIGVLANVYVFLVAALWTAIIVGILVAIASVIALIAGICFLFMAGQTCQSNSNRNVNF